MSRKPRRSAPVAPVLVPHRQSILNELESALGVDIQGNSFDEAIGSIDDYGEGLAMLTIKLPPVELNTDEGDGVVRAEFIGAFRQAILRLEGVMAAVRHSRRAMSH